jgi:hypothetical protein
VARDGILFFFLNSSASSPLVLDHEDSDEHADEKFYLLTTQGKPAAFSDKLAKPTTDV